MDRDTRSLPARFRPNMPSRVSILGSDPKHDRSCKMQPAEFSRSQSGGRASQKSIDKMEPPPAEQGLSKDFIRNLWSSINNDYENINRRYQAERSIPNRVQNPRLRSYHNFKHASSFNKHFTENLNMRGSQETLDVPAKSKSSFHAPAMFSPPKPTNYLRDEIESFGVGATSRKPQIHRPSREMGTLDRRPVVSSSRSAPSASPKALLRNRRSLSPSPSSLSVSVGMNASGRVGGKYKAMVVVDLGCSTTDFVYVSAGSTEAIRKGHSGQERLQSCLLLDQNNRFYAFGDTAFKRYSQMGVQEARKFMFFDNIVARLSEVTVSRFMRIRAANGSSKPAVDVLAHCLRYLKTLAMTTLENELKISVTSSDVQWVIGVPDVWDQAALRIMRLSAVKAGMATSFGKDHLQFVSSIEGLAMFVVQNTAGLRRLQSNGGVLPLQLRKGDSFIVLDCGAFKYEGGVFKLEQDGISEVCQRKSDVIGASSVEAGFENLLQTTLGPAALEQFKFENPPAYLQLLDNFHDSVLGCWDVSAGPVGISVPMGLTNFYHSVAGHSIQCTTRKISSAMDWSPQGYLTLSTSQLQRLHEPMIGKILFMLSRLITNSISSSIKAIVISGGFAHSPFPQESLLKVYGQRYAIYTTGNSSSAVLEGSTLAALHPRYLKLRVVKMTIGVGVMRPWDPIEHPMYKKVIRGSGAWCADVFDALTTAGHVCGAEEKVVRFYAPSSHNQAEIVVQLLGTKRQHAKFVTEDHVTHFGVLRVNLKAGQSVGGREVKVTFNIGRTELTAEAEDKISGQTLHANIDFLTTSVSTML